MHDVFQIFVRLLVFLQKIAAIGAIEPISALVGTENEGFFVVVDGLGIFFLSDTTLGACGEDFVDIRIEFDSLVEVIFGTRVVVEHQFAEGAIVPRFVKIGLRRKCIVEMLDGDDIIVVAQRDSPRNDEAVGVVLGEGSKQ